MADYWGLKAIAARMTTTQKTLRLWFLKGGFPMYRRGLHHQSLNVRKVMYFTTDALIERWQLAKAEACRRDEIVKTAQRAKRRAEKRARLAAGARVQVSPARDPSDPHPSTEQNADSVQSP